MKYYSIQPLLSRNKLFNFVVGARHIGKTYSSKENAINNFLERGEHFVYIRRYKKELRKIKTFFKDIEKKYPEHSFSCDGTYFYIDKKVCGSCQPLSTAKTEKSVVYDNVTFIIFDEFIIDKGVYHYLPDEVTNLLELYVTISDGRDIPIFFLANSITDYNPYFLYFDIQPNGWGYTTYGDIIIENVDPSKYESVLKNSRFAEIVKGTPYGQYLLENKPLRDNNNFIQKKSGTAKHIFNFKYNNYTFGVWFDTQNVYVSFDILKGHTIALTEEHISADVELNAGARSPFKKYVIKKYRQGKCYFESPKIKGYCIDIIKKYL